MFVNGSEVVRRLVLGTTPGLVDGVSFFLRKAHLGRRDIDPARLVCTTSIDDAITFNDNPDDAQLAASLLAEAIASQQWIADAPYRVLRVSVVRTAIPIEVSPLNVVHASVERVYGRRVEIDNCPTHPGSLRARIELPRGKQCEQCGGAACASLSAGRSGFSAGGAHFHAPDCSSLRCPHGWLWGQSCDECDSDTFDDREDGRHGDDDA